MLNTRRPNGQTHYLGAYFHIYYSSQTTVLNIMFTLLSQKSLISGTTENGGRSPCHMALVSYLMSPSLLFFFFFVNFSNSNTYSSVGPRQLKTQHHRQAFGTTSDMRFPMRLTTMIAKYIYSTVLGSL